MTSTIRWGILGCGAVTERKSGPAFQQAKGSSLVAVMRRTPELARDYAERHGVARWYDDADKLIGDPEVDAVYIATPPAQHKPYALACARAGKPAYVEKPMALNETECREMIEAFRSARQPLFVAYYRRALPRFKRVKELLDAEALGKIRFVQVLLTKPTSPADRNADNPPWRVVPEIAGGGHFVDLGSHTLDLIAWLLGPFKQVSGLANNQSRFYRAEDTASACFQLECGALGTGLWCFSCSERNDQVRIVGDRGSLSFSTFGDSPIVFCQGGETSEEMIPHPDPIQLPLVQSIVDELRGAGRCPSTGETAAQASWVMDQILASWRSAQLP